jgi:hypothetical protein
VLVHQVPTHKLRSIRYWLNERSVIEITERFSAVPAVQRMRRSDGPGSAKLMKQGRPQVSERPPGGVLPVKRSQPVALAQALAIHPANQHPAANHDIRGGLGTASPGSRPRGALRGDCNTSYHPGFQNERLKKAKKILSPARSCGRESEHAPCLQPGGGGLLGIAEPDAIGRLRKQPSGLSPADAGRGLLAQRSSQ